MCQGAFSKPIITEASRHGFSLGMNLGASFATITDESLYRQGYAASIIVNKAFSEVFSIHSEIGYVQKGNKYEIIPNVSGGQLIENTKHFLEIPVMARAALGNDKVKFVMNAGPAISYRLSSRADYSDGTSLSYSKDAFFGLDITGGMGLMIKAGPGHILISMRATHELHTFTPYQTNAKNVNYTITVGYIIPLGHK